MSDRVSGKWSPQTSERFLPCGSVADGRLRALTRAGAVGVAEVDESCGVRVSVVSGDCSLFLLASLPPPFFFCFSGSMEVEVVVGK